MPDEDDARLRAELRILYFLIPLTEPLAVPNGYILEFTGPEEPGFDEFVADHKAGHPPGDYTPPTYASLRFWHVPLDVRQMHGSIERVARLAHQVLGPRLRRRQRWRRFRAVMSCFLPWRLARRAPSPVRETIVEAAVVIDEDLERSPDCISEAFDRALHYVQHFQRGLYAATRTPGIVDTRESLPSVILYADRRRTESSEGWPRELSTLLVNPRVRGVPSGEILSTDEAADLGAFLRVARAGNPFANYTDLARESQVAFSKHGDYRTAVVLAATASELLLDSLLSMLVWEESKVTPEIAAKECFPPHMGLARRVQTHYASRLGGTWATRGPGEIAQWYKKLIRLRHRVVHSGYDPGAEAVHDALEALWMLEGFLKDQLTGEPQLNRYPRSAIHLLGRRGLEDSGAWSQRLEDLTNDPSEPPWLETFERWNFVVDATREEQLGEDLDPSSPSSLESVLILDESGTEVGWYQHDRKQRKVRRASPPEALPEALANHLEALRREHAPFPEHQAIVFVELRLAPIAPDEPWVWEYRVLPMVAVHLDPEAVRDLPPQ